nr:MAG: internal scaffolding protein [Microvirus sp.]
MAERNKCALRFTQPSKTKQAHLQECDINKIVARIRKNGFAPLNLSEMRGAFYGDVTNAPADYMEAQALVMRVETTFAALPAEIREKFGNNPAELAKAVANPSRREELEKMGLVQPEEKKINPESVAGSTESGQPASSGPSQEAGK